MLKKTEYQKNIIVYRQTFWLAHWQSQTARKGINALKFVNMDPIEHQRINCVGGSSGAAIMACCYGTVLISCRRLLVSAAPAWQSVIQSAP
jgi:hypothetical protein